MLKIPHEQKNDNHNKKISSPYRTISLFLVVSSLLLTTGCSSNDVVEEDIQVIPKSPAEEISVDSNVEEPQPTYSQTAIDKEFASNLDPERTRGIISTALQPDGKIVLAVVSERVNAFDNKHGLVRLNPDGSEDTAFSEAQGQGPEGLLVDFASGDINAIAVQDDGKIIVGGDFRLWDGITVGRIVRLNPDGSLDTAFTEANGEGALLGTISSIVVQPDGKIIIAGGVVRWNGDTTVRGIVRLNPNGTHDKEFTLANGGGAETAGINAVSLQDDGKILLGLRPQGNPLAHLTKWDGTPVGNIVRLNPDGSFDNNFNIAVESGAGGIYESSLRRNTSVEVNSIIVQPDGKILIKGDFTLWGGNYIGEANSWGEISYTYENATPVVAGIVRLNPDGSLDTDFVEATRELVPTNNNSNNIKINSLALQSDGKILFSTSSCWISACYNIEKLPYFYLFQLNTDGSFDADFKILEKEENSTERINEDRAVGIIMIQPDDKILLPKYSGLVRLGGMIIQ